LSVPIGSSCHRQAAAHTDLTGDERRSWLWLYRANRCNALKQLVADAAFHSANCGAARVWLV
jgi:hypothetical protein